MSSLGIVTVFFILLEVTLGTFEYFHSTHTLSSVYL
jgi:hypothetical protein